MKDLSTILLGIIFGISCAYFQYWMAVRLEKKRWLLLLQPGLLAAAGLCFGAWVLSLKNLYDSTIRFLPLLFLVLLICSAAGWIIGNIRRRRKD